MTNATVLQKVQKLLRLAKSSNPNEAANAAAMAQDLIQRHQLGVIPEELDTISSEDIHIDYEFPLVTGQRKSSWKLRLAVTVSRLNMCDVLNTPGGLLLVGKPSDAEVVRHLYTWLCGEVDRLTARDTKGRGRSYAANYRVGVVETINQRMKDQQKQTDKQVMAEHTGAALVRVKNAIALRRENAVEINRHIDRNVRSTMRPIGGGMSNYAARLHGRQAGHSVRLSPEKARLTA